MQLNRGRKPKLTREDCADIRRLYADRNLKETTGTLAHMFRVSTATIVAVLDNRYTKFKEGRCEGEGVNSPQRIQQQC